MTEQSVESEVAGKLAQALAVAVQVAEVIVRLRARKTAGRGAQARQLEGAVKAERTARYAADRVTWSRASEPRWLQDASINDLGRAWGAAAGWADTDPSAARAADKVEQRLRTIDPDAMADYDRARAAGADRITAMREVFTRRATTSAAPGRFFVGEPAEAAATGGATARPDNKQSAADRAADHFPVPYTTVVAPQHAAAPPAPSQQPQPNLKTQILSR